MIGLLSKLWIKDGDNVASFQVRQAYGMLCGALGICLNILLFLGKILAGTLSKSIAITADAFNNLSDAGSSLITLIGFKMSGQEADPDHPFGHGRIEYISGLIVSGAILIMGYELIVSSFKKVLQPEETSFSPLIAMILLASILVKLYMAYYNFSVGKKISSSAMKATATDSLSDTVTTAVVLIATLAEHFFKWKIDGFCGILVGLFILYAGFNAARDTINPLLGQPPAKEFVEQIQQIVLNTDGVLGMHDLIVHDYGPGRVIISLHAEVSAAGNILEIHDMIDRLEQTLNKQLNCEAVIHMDPVVTQDPDIDLWKDRIHDILFSIDSSLHMHDFRMVKGNTHTNIIFDMVLPHNYKMDKALLLNEIQERVWAIDKSFNVVIQMEHSYV
ncbi:MAG: cation diffusion facilitator family transporter [Lachnospiraceae bacterium]|nr:cation diffusion facilitator family transporter [Lachnospiraceae bacterium]MDD7025828.1 cation diffusion facilitator family transporter [Lachnospiraceae bacterium]MDY5701732.1 cation diffusion facilitator family transporter [Lachnospiraceae bacterium]